MAATEGLCVGDPAAPIAGFSIDSRNVAQGDGFIAIRGPNRDGHDFVGKAISAGAGCAVVEEGFPKGLSEGEEAKLVRVVDTFVALNDLGACARARATEAVVIGVTGSAGKTGTKEALRVALAPSGTVHASSKSFNNHWGVPLTLANMPHAVDFGVFEIGMNHAGEIDVLTTLVRPHIAIVTTVAPVHLGFFRSLEEIADAKAEIFHGLEPGGTAILNRDSPYFGRLAAHARKHGADIVSFGEDEHADARLLSSDLSPDGSEVTADILGDTVSFRLGVPGRHVVQNTLAVLAAVKLAGADLAASAQALGSVRAQVGRGARCVIGAEGAQTCIVDDSYNANPASMRAALATLGLAPRSAFKRRVAVLGDMLELGDEGPNLHRDLAESVDAAGVDVVFACGALMASLFQALPRERQGAHAQTSETLAPALLKGVLPGDIVMVKGSLGSRMAPLVGALKRRFEAEGPPA